MKFAAFIVASVLLAQPASIAVQEAERARQLMGSARVAERAWGVYLAGRSHADELSTALLEQFRSAAVLRDAPSFSEDYAFVATLFDATIESGMIVPAALLEPFAEKWIDPVMILLARDPGSEDVLLVLRANAKRTAVWLAAGNILLERKSQRWFAATLDETGITHRFTVVDPGDNAGSGEGKGGGLCGDGAVKPPPHFPPVALFELATEGQRGSVFARARTPKRLLQTNGFPAGQAGWHWVLRD